jgi:D-alanyl-D-alanine carboxypeptidase
LRRRRWAASTAACAALAVSVLAGPAVQAAPPATEPEVAASASANAPNRYQTTLDNLVTVDEFPGALASVRNAKGKVRNYTAGVADIETGKPIKKDAPVRIASNTKTFTATVVLQLVQEGKIALDAPVETYLPGIVRGEGIDGRAITVRQLLNHTSGLVDYDQALFADGPASNLDVYYEPRELVDVVLREPALAAPGAAWSYSSGNYILAGLIVQKVTGRPISEEITKRIIEPLGLKNTYWPEVGDMTLPTKAPNGYLAETPGGPLIDVTELDPSSGWAAGQLVSTPSELNEFFVALLDGELIGPAMLAEMKTTVPSPGSNVYVEVNAGLGLDRISLSCGDVWGHGGNVQGFTTRNGVTAEGRAATVAVTELPNTLEKAVSVEKAVEAALCS